MKNKQHSKLADNFGQILSYTVNEAILIKKMKKYFDPRPAELFKSKKTEKIITRKISKLSKKFGGPPQIVSVSDEQASPKKFDMFVYTAIDEMTSMYQRSYNSVCIAHIYFICKGLLEKHPDFLKKTDQKEINNVILPMISNQFYDKAEIAYIRLSSYWDRVGQLLDFVFFNIREYERDVFSKVLSRIKTNYVLMHNEIKMNNSWQRLQGYHKSEKTDGMNWLFSRRNLLVHRLHLSSNYQIINDNPIFISDYNHLKNTIQNKLSPKNEQEEINILHSHLKKAADLFDDVIELCLIGAELRNPNT